MKIYRSTLSFAFLLIFLLNVGILSLKAYSLNESSSLKQLINPSNIEENNLKVVHNIQSGKLKSIIDKKEILQITKLKVTGEISDKDINFIGKMVNLTILDLSEIKGVFYNFPLLPKLVELYLPETFLLCEEAKHDISRCTNIEILSTCVAQVDRGTWYRYYWDFPRMPKLRKVIATKYFERSVGGARYSQPIDTLVLTSFNSRVGSFKPEIIINTDEKTILENYISAKRKNFDGIQIFPDMDEENKNIYINEELILPDAEIIGRYYFQECPIKNITFSPYIKEIRRGAFKNCSSLNKIVFKANTNPLTIDYNAFENCKNLKTIRFESPVKIEYTAFKGCILDSVIFMNDVIMLSHTFDKVNYIEFKIVPKELYSSFISSSNYKCIVVPKGSTNKFIKFGIPENKIIEAGKRLSLNITVKKPGTILSYLPLDALTTIDSLTITGFLYETDLAVINQCNALTYLDLSHTFITDSPQAKQAKEDEAKALLGFVKLLGFAADLTYGDGNLSNSDYIMMKALAKLGEYAEDSEPVKQANENCFIPKSAFKNMQFLKAVKLPLSAIEIKEGAFYECKNLENIQLPPYLKSIDKQAFAYCRNLRNIDFPTSLSVLEAGAFQGCDSIKKVDLSKNTFSKFSYSFSGYGLKELKLPNGFGSSFECYKNCIVYYPSSLTQIGGKIHDCELHFSSPIPPKFSNEPMYDYEIKDNKIYIPKGSLTAYFTTFGKQNTYVEE